MSKRTKLWRDGVDERKLYAVDDALALIKSCATVQFDESVDVAVNLGVDTKKSDQVVRGSSILPRGTGKSLRVAVFARGDQAKAAQSAGADVVGCDDLAESIQAGKIDFDVVIAATDTMPVVSKLGRILGSRGLMPNPKSGTVSADVGQSVKNAKAGQVRYRTDKNGIIHCAIGKASFEVGALKENLEFLLSDLLKAKPSSAKGVYLKKISLSTTMGPGITVDQGSLAV